MTDAASPALDVHGLGKSFGGVRAVADVTFSVPRGSLTAVIGPNGAGKSTLFNLITNLYTPDTGSVRFFGRNIRRVRPHDLAIAGLVRTFQTARIFSGLTVLENVLVGAHLASRAGFVAQMFAVPGVRRRERELERSAEELLDIFGLSEMREEPAITLALGSQKLVELARAVMAAPKVLLLDEPAAGLNDFETEEFARVLRALNAAGTTIIVVEHNMSLVMGSASNIIVLDAGVLIAHGSPQAIQSDPAVIAAYVGGNAAALAAGASS